MLQSTAGLVDIERVNDSKRHHRRPREAGFILIWGTKSRVGDDGSEPVHATCPCCRQQAVFRGRVVRRWFTLFFIPILPLGASARFCECTMCGQHLNRPIEHLAAHGGGLAVSDDAFAARTGPAGDNPVAAAMRMHHDMLANPEDSARLLKLIRHYIAMDEPADAKAACRAFPVAFNNDPACADAMRAIG